MLLVVPAYAVDGRTHVDRRRLINYGQRGSSSPALPCSIATRVRAGVRIGIAYFLWIGIFNVMIVAQFWSFANDVYTRDEGERLFPIVAFGASAGAVVGATVVGQLIEPLGIYMPMLVAAVVLALQVQITNSIDRHESLSGRARVTQVEAETPVPVAPDGAGQSAFGLVMASRYLLMIALVTMTLNWVNTSGEYILGRIVNDTAEAAVAAGTTGGLSEGQFIGKFYADFFGVVNLAGLLIQLFLVSRIIKFLGIRVGLLILPFIAIGAYALIALFPVLAVARWSKTAENATDYSLNNTVRHALFLVCTPEQKYKAKQVTDSFFWRAGDLLSAVVVFVGTSIFAWTITRFALFNLILVAFWLVLAFFIGKEYTKRVQRTADSGDKGPTSGQGALAGQQA